MTGKSGLAPRALWRWLSRIRTPAPFVVWTLATLVVVTYPVTSSFYWIEVAEAGLLPHDGDSMGIPILNSVMSAIFGLTPWVILVNVICLNRTEQRPALFGWNNDRPWLSGITTFFLGLPAALLVLVCVVSAFQTAYWFDFLWTPYFLVVAAWLASVRARCVTKARTKPARPRAGS